MRQILGLVAAATLTLATVQNVGAQQAVTRASPTAPSDTRLRVGTQQNGAVVAPRFSVFGVPIGINAPVNAPYCNCALNTFAGQPMNGQDAVVALANGASR